jgi:CubicO group peptidase (beta-lactamase class C family)
VKRLLKVLKNSAIVVIILGILLEGFTLVIHYPNPIASIRLGLAPASKTPTLMPAHIINPSTNPIELPTGSEKAPASVNWQGKDIPWQEFLDKSYTNALLILRNGVITYQYYRDGFTPTTRLPAYSVGKTMISLVVGQLIAQGKIKESDTLVHYLPEYKTGGSFDKITIQQLLDMQSGVGVNDNYPAGPSGWGVAIAQMYATTDMNWFLKHNRKMAFEPGTKSIYRSVDPQFIGMVVKKVTGMKIADYFAKYVWQPIGALTPATWNVDRVGGVEKTFCCFNAAAPDYAKVGLMILNNGMVGDKHIIDANWVKRLANPATQIDDWGYGAYMWHPFPGVSSMDGLHGQYVYIDPKTRTVIVKLSDVPTTLNLGKPTMEVFKEISNKQN